MQDYEKLGVFYLGRHFDLDAKKPLEDLILYDSKDLTTHAVCVGMTGSGKTGLCLALLEEAAIDGIPALIIDPKGDLGNLMLTFPELKADDFAPWIDPAEVARSGGSSQDFAQKTADRWKKGLADWGQPPERIQRLRDAADIAIYTPGGTMGLPLTVMKSFAAPPESTLANADAFREAIAAAAASLLGLLGIDADPLKSREQILLSNILERNWREGKSLDMTAIIRAIQAPPFDKIGVIDLESFYPAKERFDFSLQLNNLLASPGFSAWMDGEPLDIQRLLWTKEGKPRLTILSIAHLSDAERMFFVTILLSELITWMRAQSGTSSLRAMLYMDEVFGYFPPNRNPPSKTPMLTLLKQARAFGLGVVLATQNPVDLDYKGLANCGTWFLGRLQTERDKLRVLDGLEGAASQAGGGFNRAEMDQLLSGLGSRVFLMNNVHEDHPVVFQSRWALSYLRGPLNREEIARLMAPRKKDLPASASHAAAPPQQQTAGGVSIADQRPVLPPEIVERYTPLRSKIPAGAKLVYRPAIYGAAKVHFAQAAAGVDAWQSLFVVAPLAGDADADLWSDATVTQDDAPELETEPEPAGTFAELPAELSRAKKFAELAGSLKDHLYREEKLTLWKCADPKATSQPGESEADFRVRLSHSAREDRDASLEDLRRKYAPKLAALEEQKRKAQARVEKQKSQSTQQILNTVLSLGSTVLGAICGRKLTSVTNINRAASSMKSASKIIREQQDVTLANESVEAIQARIDALNEEFQVETNELQASADASKLELQALSITPKKADIAINQIALLWQPWLLQSDGSLVQAK